MMKLFLFFCLLSALLPLRAWSFNASEAMVGTPKKVMYIDYQGINWNSPQTTVTQAVSAGYNVVILSFLLSSGPADMAEAWVGVSQSDQQSTIQAAHAQGAIVIVSAGGSTDSPYSSMSGAAYGTMAANWANANNLDGVDFDMENFGPPLVAGSLNPQQTIQWLADATNTAKQILGSGKVITHAPQAPYFGGIGGGKNPWTGSTGGYSAVYEASADSTDWYNVQFYNQGASCYVDYTGLFTDSSSCSPFPGTSVQEISSYGVPLSKIVVGKYVQQGDASNGWVDPSTLGQYFNQAQSIGWNAGVMGWVWHDPTTNQQWISSIY